MMKPNNYHLSDPKKSIGSFEIREILKLLPEQSMTDLTGKLPAHPDAKNLSQLIHDEFLSK
jgi:hypothetical protein